MNKKMIFTVVGKIIGIECVLMFLPLITALIYGEYRCAVAFGGTIVISAALSAAITHLCKTSNKTIYSREGFVIVATAWFALSVLGAFPLVLSGDIPSFVDAFFEIVSGFTTTGASILTDVEALSHGALFWRSFTHWIGGMGVIVLMMAILPDNSGRSIHIMRAEMPGPSVDKIVPKVRDTAKILYLIYIAMTAVMVIFLLAGKMPLFDSIIHAFGTAGTGGFGTKADSIAGYSPYLQWVITVFMFIFGINFNLYFLILIRKFRSALRSEELLAYTALVLASVASICVNLGNMYETVSETVRQAAFQVLSIITTTGYSTIDFNLWPDFSKAILLLLMFIGGCAGSTAGGLKVSRVVILFKAIQRELKMLIHPRAVAAVKFEGKRLDEPATRSVCSYFAIYMFFSAVIFLIISFEPFGFETNFSAVVTCFNNVGPGFAGVGPLSSFAAYTDFSKLLLSLAMLLGRLEIYPILLTLAPTTWYKK